MPVSPESSPRPDYIIVVTRENLGKLNIYLSNLKNIGLKWKTVNGVEVDLIFINIFVPNDAMRHFARLYEIGIYDASTSDIFFRTPIFHTPFRNPLNEYVLKQGQLTAAEKILVVNKILEHVKFGPKDRDFGLSKLTTSGWVHTSYPLHDGPVRDGGTNMRSLMHEYWSNTKVAHMQQPLDMIFYYYGSEIAFYFAWLEHFNMMLSIPAVLGALVFLTNLSIVTFWSPVEVYEICNSEKYLCPYCETSSKCKFAKVSNFCSLSAWTFVFDNHLTLIFAVIVAFWTTWFVLMWRRKENKLKLRWHCEDDERETTIRQVFIEKAKHHARNSLTGEIEPYQPKMTSTYHYTVTFISCALLICLILSVIILLMIGKVMFLKFCTTSDSKFLITHSKILTMCLGSIIQVLCMKVFGKVYGPASIKLTKFENPRTQMDFDNSVLYKRYLLSFFNNYLPMMYLAFFKGRFILPSHKMTLLRKDVCQPSNCILALCITLTFLLTIRLFMGNLVSMLIPTVKKCVKSMWRLFKKKKIVKINMNLPQWEEEYYLEPVLRYSVTKEFSEMVIRLGHIVFYPKAFPLGAICVLLNNLIETRTDSYKFVKLYRRPVPLHKSGIGAWNGILTGLCYFSTAMNAFVTAFTSDWVPRQVYHLSEHTLKGYLDYSLSKYKVSDHKGYDKLKNAPEFCYYRGHFNGPEDPDAYEKTDDFWKELAFRLITVLVFEHVVLAFNAIVSFCFPYKSESVRLQIELEYLKKRRLLIGYCDRKLKQRMKSTVKVIRILDR